MKPKEAISDLEFPNPARFNVASLFANEEPLPVDIIHDRRDAFFRHRRVKMPAAGYANNRSRRACATEGKLHFKRIFIRPVFSYLTPLASLSLLLRRFFYDATFTKLHPRSSEKLFPHENPKLLHVPPRFLAKLLVPVECFLMFPRRLSIVKKVAAACFFVFLEKRGRRSIFLSCFFKLLSR